MKVHLRADERNDEHTRFTVFVNGANCGQLCMKTKEADIFGNFLNRGHSRTLGDEFKTSGRWWEDETKEGAEQK